MQEPTIQPAEIRSPLAYLRALLDGGKVHDVLQSVAVGGDLSLACSIDGSQHVFASNPAAFSADTRVEVGCVAKNLTALLVAMAVSEGRLSYEDNVSRFFPGIRGIDASLRIHHLLNHSHGLDGSLLADLPRSSDGHIDAAAIWHAVHQVPAISPPGKLFYYYGNVGMWLAGAVLEGIHGTTYSALLREKVLLRISPGLPVDDGLAICPASGGFRLSASELLELCRFHLKNHQEDRLNNAIHELRSRSSLPLPRWPPMADRAGPGWFHFRGASFGIFGQGDGTSLLLVMSPGENAAAALTGRGEVATQFARPMLLGPLLSSRKTRPPRLLTRDERASLSLKSVLGRYRKASHVLDISRTAHGELQASIFRCGSGGDIEEVPLVTKLLLPAAENFFFPARPDPAVLPHLRFEEADAEGSFRYVHTGKHVFRRAG